MTFASLNRRTEQLLRDLAPQVLGATLRRFRDFAACEDAVQEALIAAASQWPRDGAPQNPRGWLIQVALRRMTDHVRSEISRRNRETVAVEEVPVVVAPAVYAEPGIDPDDTLVLLFMCCHPSLSPASAIALTLRAVGGLTTAEIAKSFLVPEATMAQRISRAKQSIESSRVPFGMPDAAERAQRLSSVLHVLYLIFNEGYTSSSGPTLHRTDLSNEAIRLTRAVRTLLPDDAQVAGLLALMLLTDARRAARTGPVGELIPLDEQDRSLWDRLAIDEGVRILEGALALAQPGPYQMQAAIAALHGTAAAANETDWPQIAALYQALLRSTPTPIVELNAAVALGLATNLERALEWIDDIAARSDLTQYHLLPASKADMLRRLGRCDEAAIAYRDALGCCGIMQPEFGDVIADRLCPVEPALVDQHA